jgi:hypothetical protein
MVLLKARIEHRVTSQGLERRIVFAELGDSVESETFVIQLHGTSL